MIMPNPETHRKNQQRPEKGWRAFAERYVEIGAYPLIVGTTLAVFCGLEEHLPPFLAAYLSLPPAVVSIVWLETIRPYRKTWRPQAGDMIVDGLYLVTVQIALANGLSWGVVGLTDTMTATIWPSHWPTIAQVVLMLLVADLSRYGLHRLSHSWAPLWRLHQCHHQPGKLYWLNVGRFHPIDKSLQFAVDCLPFLLLGVSETVLAGYFVFYAVNGFFQHSNGRFRLGFLNHVIAGPELHRWHHAKNVADANCNFGNNLIVWDWLFGTRYLPADRAVGALGLSYELERAYDK